MSNKLPLALIEVTEREQETGNHQRCVLLSRKIIRCSDAGSTRKPSRTRKYYSARKQLYRCTHGRGTGTQLHPGGDTCISKPAGPRVYRAGVDGERRCIAGYSAPFDSSLRNGGADISTRPAQESVDESISETSSEVVEEQEVQDITSDAYLRDGKIFVAGGRGLPVPGNTD